MSLFPARVLPLQALSVTEPAQDGPGADRRRERAVVATVGAIAVAGLALRLWCSAGPLWVDEVWSLRNLRPITHFWDILWGISHDNNHFANSLWLFFALPLGDNSTWLRLPSILAGALAIPVMARLGARSGPAGSIAVAALAALSFFQLTYSVEARGYAGATLALMVGFAALERAIAEPRGSARLLLAAAAGVGLFCHLAVGPAMVLYGLIALGEILRREGSARRAVIGAFHIFWPTTLAMAPATFCVLAGIVFTGGFTIGAARPYAASHALAAMTNMAMTTLGLWPESRPAAAFALLALPLLLVGAILWLAPVERRIAYGVTLIGVPAAVFVLHPANSHPPRYFFLCSIFLLLLAADAFAALWRRPDSPRALALCALAAVLLGDAASAARFEAGKRATWPDALAAVAASGETRLASNLDFNVGKEVDAFNRSRGATLDLVPAEALCARAPAWYVLESAQLPATPVLTVEGAGCRLTFALQGVYDEHIPSQTPWALYQRR